MSEKRFNLRFYTLDREAALTVFVKIADGFNYPPTLSKNMNTGEYYLSTWLTQGELDALGLKGQMVQNVFFVPPEAAELE